MDESILFSIKKLLGVEKETTAFDQDILININAVFSTLYQIGVGTEGHYTIINEEDTWEEVFKDREDLIDFIKLYTYIKVRIVFDPPSSSFVLDSLTRQCQELEWRIHIQAESLEQFDSCDCEEGTISDEAIEDLWNGIMNS